MTLTRDDVMTAKGAARASRRRAARRLMRSPLVWIVGICLTWFIVVLLVMPNATLLAATFFPDGAFSTRAIERLLSSERAMRSLGNSLLLAVTLAITVNVVGIFLVLVTKYFDLRGARVLWLGYATTLIYGGIVLAAGYSFIYGRYGFVTNLVAQAWPDVDRDWFSGYFAVVVVMTLATTTNHMLFLSSALASIDAQTIEAARIMGASDWAILWRIVLPVMRPMIFAVTVLTFLTGLGALTAPLVLGGEGFQTVAPMILAFSKTSSSQDIAALLAVMLGVVTIVLLTIMNRIERSGVAFSIAKVTTPLTKQPIRGRVARVIVPVIAWVLFVVYVSPVLLIVLFSFLDSRAIPAGTITADSFTIEHWVTVLTDAGAMRPFLVSIIYSALSSIIAVVGLLFVARLLSRHRGRIATLVEHLLHIPWILPTILIALGLVMTFDTPNPGVGGVVLTGTPWLLLIAYVIIKVPFTLRLLKAAFASVPASLEEAASILGASSMRTLLRVVFPLVVPVALAIAGLNFNATLDDYDAAVFLYHPLLEPLGIAIQNSTKGDDSLDAMSLTFVYTVLLMIVQGVVMWLVYGRGTRRGTRKARR